MKINKKLVTIALIAVALSGCANMTRSEKGMAIGGVSGAVIGGAATHSAVGAGVGAVAGGLVGRAAAQ